MKNLLGVPKQLAVFRGHKKNLYSVQNTNKLF